MNAKSKSGASTKVCAGEKSTQKKTGRGPVRFRLQPLDDDNQGKAILLRVGVSQIIGRAMLRNEDCNAKARIMVSREHVLVQTRRGKGENEGKGQCESSQSTVSAPIQQQPSLTISH